MNERFRIAEIKLFLLLIPLINLFNYYLTYSDISFTRRTFLTFAIDTVEGYAAWAAVHFIILYLDKRLPFEGNVFKRLAVQVSATVLVGMSIIVGLTVIIHYSLKEQPMPIGFFKYDIFIISVWFLVVNGIYVSLHFYREWQSSQRRRSEENRIKSGGLSVKSGKQEIILNFEEIAGFGIDGEYSTNGKKFLLDQSMDKLEKQLPSPWLFRLNRQFMLHQVIVGFEKAENEKLNVMVKAPLFFVSDQSKQNREHPNLKNWFHTN
jgi:DNA-binding LytR/AlgR family response regulator